jgi:hypothetical protein
MLAPLADGTLERSEDLAIAHRSQALDDVPDCAATDVAPLIALASVEGVSCTFQRSYQALSHSVHRSSKHGETYLRLQNCNSNASGSKGESFRIQLHHTWFEMYNTAG